MIQSVSFTSAAFETFAEAYQCFAVSSSAKQNAEVIKFLGVPLPLNIYIYIYIYDSENKIYFCSRKKSPVSPNKKVAFVFYTIFKQFYNTDHLLYYPQMSLFSFHTFFLL